ncbi:hypothetical protein [Streptomyces californicus]|uniref:hypothetical protein n=1 Tax=Streptomyces californicus TaxID=67351 RepID=UPI00296FD536|nr:hypothetical protein [Streptomyces californicus]MDW4916111.1 hypothetical protein [Streptomyces californicus]
MPRRRPSALRADLRRFAAPHRYSTIGRLSGPAQAQIIRLERTRLRPGVIERALVRWASIARAPKDRLPSPFTDRCGVPECCPEPAEDRDLLELAIHALPRKSAGELRALVHPLDLKILQRPDAMPFGPAPHRWWHTAF